MFRKAVDVDTYEFVKLKIQSHPDMLFRSTVDQGS